MERILIADTSEAARRTLRDPLEAEGFAVTEAQTAEDALRELRARGHHVVLADIDLPGGSFELLDELKTDPDLAGTAVVMLSDDLGEGSALAAMDRGAADCLRKPVEPIEAVVRTRAALRTATLQHRLREGNERLTELAATDDLTGLLARRFLEPHLRGLVAAAARHRRPLSVVMIDLDNFKETNDVHGHAVGDFVLRTVVSRMQSRLRQEDLLGRWGGDELILVLPDVDLDGALTAAEALREAIAETDITIDGEPSRVTVSAGAAAWDGDSANDLVRRADAALYGAKEAGRNRVRAAGLARPA